MFLHEKEFNLQNLSHMGHFITHSLKTTFIRSYFVLQSHKKMNIAAVAISKYLNGKFISNHMQPVKRPRGCQRLCFNKTEAKKEDPLLYN